MENIPGLDRHITDTRLDPFNKQPSEPCPECEGCGFTYSDPDGKEITCQFCGGEFDDTYDKRRRDAKAEREAQVEDAGDERRLLRAEDAAKGGGV